MMEKQTKIGTVCSDFDTFQLKSVLVKNDAGDWGSEPDKDAIGVIRSTNFNNDGKLDLSDIAYRTLSKRKFEEKKLYASDILIERSGGSETQPVGRVGFITDEMAKTDYAFANFIQRISLNDEVNAKFVYYCLQQMYEMGITAGMQSQTTGIRNLDWKQYIKVAIPKPSPDEQSAIAAILSKVDEAIAAVQDSIAAAERLKKSLMQNLLTGRMKPDGTLRKEDEFYVDEKFGRVPKGWEVKAIGDKDLCKINPVYKYKKKEVYDFIPMEAIKENFEGVDYVEKQVIDNGSYTRFKAGDILFAKITPCSENGKVAYIDHIDSEVGFASTEFIVFHPTENVDGKYVYLLLSSGNVHRLAISLMEGTTGRQRIPWKIFRNRIFVPMPDKVEQTIIVDKILAFDKQIKENNSKIAVLERLKKSLMQNLLTGRVRVKISN
jgi:type I restriction enzyme S subunit